MRQYRITVACKECSGDGFIEVEYMPGRTSYNDAPEPYCEAETCENCGGDGEIEVDDVDFDEQIAALMQHEIVSSNNNRPSSGG